MDTVLHWCTQNWVWIIGLLLSLLVIRHFILISQPAIEEQNGPRQQARPPQEGTPKVVLPLSLLGTLVWFLVRVTILKDSRLEARKLLIGIAFPSEPRVVTVYRTQQQVPDLVHVAHDHADATCTNEEDEEDTEDEEDEEDEDKVQETPRENDLDPLSGQSYKVTSLLEKDKHGRIFWIALQGLVCQVDLLARMHGGKVTRDAFVLAKSEIRKASGVRKITKVEWDTLIGARERTATTEPGILRHIGLITPEGRWTPSTLDEALAIVEDATFTYLEKKKGLNDYGTLRNRGTYRTTEANERTSSPAPCADTSDGDDDTAESDEYLASLTDAANDHDGGTGTAEVIWGS